MVKTEKLTKNYKVGFLGRKMTALQGLDLEVSGGEVFGFLGPNGAGKTTTIKILMGLIFPTSGKAWIMDRPIGDVKIRQMVGYLPETPYFYDYLTGEEFLHFYGQLLGISSDVRKKRINDLLRLVGLEGAGGLQLRKYSKGMIQRIGIAQALINEPKLIILDEPMSGLDPIGRKEVRDIILGMKDRGVTVFFSTHIIPDVEVICDRVGILNKGKLVSVGKIEDLVGQKVKSVEINVRGLKEGSLSGFAQIGATVTNVAGGALISLPGEEHLGKALDMVRQGGGQVVSVVPVKPSLEEIFIEELKQA